MCKIHTRPRREKEKGQGLKGIDGYPTGNSREVVPDMGVGTSANVRKINLEGHKRINKKNV